MRNSRHTIHPFRVGRLQARRGGAVTLEVILTLPIVLILLLAIVQFGILFLQLQQLSLACRVGAEEASQTFNIPNEGENPGDLVPATITGAITQQLSSSSIEPCSIILEYNVNSPFNEQVLRTDFTPNCTMCIEPTDALPVNAVRVTVCVEMTELMPNCLASLGFDITGRTMQCSNTFSYESP